MSSYLYSSDASSIEKNTSIKFSENSRKILEKRYLLKDEEGNVRETPEEMFERISKVVAEPDASYRDKKLSNIEFYNLLSTKKFFPNSPTFTGAGTPLGQLAACFVLPIADDLGRRRDSILSTLGVAGLIQQSGGGNGFSFSDLRPRGSVIASSNGAASGPVGFLKIYDGAFGEIAQGGIRRGANMAVLRVDHPDVREFIKCKSSEGTISNFNISVALTDVFMEAVKKDTTYDLISPKDGKVMESPKAREIFDIIVKNAYKNGEPGVLFIDSANKQNPVPHLYSLNATNPCGEQWLGPYENCCLGSINLGEHLDDTGSLSWEELQKTITLSTRFLDNVVTANGYIEEVPELREAALNVRRIGLGFMGLADVMYSMGIRYGSEEGQEFAAQVAEFIRYHSMKTSVELARERGPFPKIKGSIYDKTKLVWSPPKPIKPFKKDWGRPEVNWDEVVGGIKKHGIRNGAQTTVAPTGTISTVAGVEGYGCEPNFALAYYRNVYQAAGDEERLTLTYVSPYFQKAIDELGFDEDKRKRIVDRVINIGSCQGVEELPEHVRNAFVVSADITPKEHILMQASIQAFVDNSISKTCNFPDESTEEDVANAYTMGWELGCKGLTVYVAGSRVEEVLETQETKDRKKDVPAAIRLMPSDRGYVLSGSTYKLKTPQGKAFITVNRDPEGKPFEIFLNVGKAGSDVAALSEALGRLMSGWLRASYSAEETAKEIISQLVGIGGSKSVGFGKNRVASIADAVAKVLMEEFAFEIKSANGTPNDSEDPVIESTDGKNPFKNTDMCPECGNYTLVYEEGCEKCYNCAFSAC
jgi:ribonucleoside-diphosphate reductase alpha chain